MELTQNILEYIEAHGQEAYDLLIELAQIPAPSNHEERRAAYVRDWLVSQGAEGVTVDGALNVIYPVDARARAPSPSTWRTATWYSPTPIPCR